jgi:prepilin peptidase CpaA
MTKCHNTDRCHIALASTIAFLLVMSLAAGSDIATRRIPNWLVLGGTVCALGLRGVQGIPLFWDGLTGWGLGFAVTLPFFALRALGGGDAKLIMTVGAFMGASELIGALLVIAIVGGIIGLLYSARRGMVLPTVLHAWDMLRGWLTPGGRRDAAPPEGGQALTIPYGLAIAIGAVVWWFWGGKLA